MAKGGGGGLILHCKRLYVARDKSPMSKTGVSSPDTFPLTPNSTKVEESK